jgi:hypothetical protein
MNAQVQMTLPADTRTAVLEAVEQGVSDAVKTAAERESSAAADATEVIATIPALIREATAEGVRKKIVRFRATLMPLGVDDCTVHLSTTASNEVSPSYVDRDRLVGAALLVWDHCVAADLHIFVSCTTKEVPDDINYRQYSLDIAWSLPESKDAGKKKRKWRWFSGLVG